MNSPVNSNPLAKHFRQPALYITLTSKGKFWPANALEIPVTGEIPVYPMTARDEITLRTPDALINGTSVVDVIQSCCPNIKNAWQMPSVDVDSTLIAIRIASYGQLMSVNATCPSCNQENDYDVDLHSVLSKIRMPNYDETVKTKDGLIIALKPMTYQQVSQAGNVMFEEERMIQTLANPDIEENVRLAKYDAHIKKMIELNVENVTNSTLAIIAQDGTQVTDVSFIKEYYQNVEGVVIRSVQDKAKEFADTINIKHEETLCSNCETKFKLNIEFDYSRFFAKGF
jgi:hypothetical protein